MVGLLIKYKKNTAPNEILNSYIEGDDYETVLRKFLKIKGGKKKITITSAQDWDRYEERFTIDKPITLEDETSVVYKIMNE